MKIINKYVLKEHVGPFFFALTALTSLMILQFIAKKFGDLVGKGLSWQVIAKFFLLSIPFTVAMTLPMAVLVAVLYAFSRFGAENEVTALKAGGFSTRALMRPVLGAGFVLSLFMLWFNDQVLPDANHTLETLQADIARTKPTFALREHVINPVEDRVFLEASRIDPETSRMADVTFYDLADPTRRRTIIAKTGVITMASNQHDMLLTLYNGVIISVPTTDPAQMDRVYFGQQDMRVKDVVGSFQATSPTTQARQDREMSICDMQTSLIAAKARTDQARAEVMIDYWASNGRVGIAPVKPPYDTARGLGYYYCHFMTALQKKAHALAPKAAHAAELPLTRATLAPARPQVPPAPGRAVGAAQVTYSAARAEYILLKQAEVRFAIEIQKKFALAAACMVLAFVGAPIALRFPRGGVGLVIGVSFTIFALYYVCLIGGEALADNLKIVPFWSMWAANVIFTSVGLVLFWRMGYESGSSRGGGLRELIQNLRARFGRHPDDATL